ncbi:MAG TPA: hypothetical protein ENJ18_10445 [Nannocystis exedens]|nr:hypothetical protein [Nannocystis exedens]
MSTGFTVRPFQDSVQIMRAANPQGHLYSGVAEHHASELACSFDELGVWPKNPPVALISAQRITDEQAIEMTRDPRALVAYCNFGGAVGTWNANGEGRWAASPGEWIVVDVELAQEQAEGSGFVDTPGAYVDVVFALWRIQGGWACAVWSPIDCEALAIIMGLDHWPRRGWTATKVWYGE